MSSPNARGHALALALALVALLGTTQLPAQSRAPVVVGRVTDTAGSPLAQATVFLPGTAVHMVTDTLGEFAFDSLPAAVVSLRAAFIGYRPHQLDSVRVERGRTTRIAFRLSESGLKPTCTLGPR